MSQILRLVLVLFLLLKFIAAGQEVVRPPESVSSPHKDAIETYEAFVPGRMAFDRIPGLSVGFIKDDFIWARGFGFSDLESKIPALPTSSYRLASITKTFTALAVLQLVEEGKITLDEEIQTYVPSFPKKKWPVTVRQLLGHLGGISHYKNYAQEGRIKEPKTTQEALAIFKDFDLVGEPGTVFHYSSYGFNLLGAAIENVSRMSYGEFLQKRIFDPLGMESSRMDDPLELIPRRVRGYQLVDGQVKNSEYVDISSRFAAGGVRSSVIDLLRYARGIIDGKFLRESSWEEMFRPMALQNGTFTWTGMAWEVQPLNGHFSVSHGGDQPETRTFLLILPEEKFAVAITANLEATNLMPYVVRLSELVLEEDLDISAYAPNRILRTIYGTVFQVFTHGMSFFTRHGSPLTENPGELMEAFAYFNENVNEKALGENFVEAQKKLQAGIHPASGQALTKVGSYMASLLQEMGSREKLLDYHRQGPLAFFSDYIALASEIGSSKSRLNFREDFIRLISGWQKDWDRTYTEFVRNFVLTPETDFDEARERLTRTFSGASLYPDFSSGLANLAAEFLGRNNMEKTGQILTLCLDLYPGSPLPYTSMGIAKLWQGMRESGLDFVRKAFELDLTDPVVAPEKIVHYTIQLARINRIDEALALGDLALEYHPKEAKLYVAFGDLCVYAGETEKAADCYKRALRIDKRFEEARSKLRALQKR